MSYDYIRRTYPVTPKVGERVRHKETGEFGTISRENRSMSHYVMVAFPERLDAPLPCHPTALEYLGRSSTPPTQDHPNGR